MSNLRGQTTRSALTTPKLPKPRIKRTSKHNLSYSFEGITRSFIQQLSKLWRSHHVRPCYNMFHSNYIFFVRDCSFTFLFHAVTVFQKYSIAMFSSSACTKKELAFCDSKRFVCREMLGYEFLF